MKLIDLLEETIQEIGDLSAGSLPMTKPSFLPKVKTIMSTLEDRYKRSGYKSEGISMPGITTYVATGQSGQKYDIKVEYEVEIKNKKFSTNARVDFDVKRNKQDVKDTNLEEQYKLVSSVVLAMIDFANKIEPIAPLTNLWIYPKADDSQVSTIDSKRGRFYKVYITKNLKNLPGNWKVTDKEESFQLDRIN